MKPTATDIQPARWSFLSVLSLLLLLVPALAVAWALQNTQLLADLPKGHAAMLGMLLAACACSQLLAWLLWRRSLGLVSLALGAALFWGTQLVYYVGAGQVLVSVALACGALAVGSLLLSSERHGPLDRLLVGTAVVVSLVAWLLPFPIHDTRLYIGLFAVLLVGQRRQIWQDGRDVGRQLSALGQEHPLLLALVAVVTGFASLGLWLPSLNYDDNSAHLAIQSQLLRDGYYHLDFGTQLWALAPWFNNVWHAVAAMLLGEESRAAVGLIWLLLGVAGAWRLALAVGGSRRAALLAAAVYASHPLTAYFGTTLQVDGPTAVLLLHLFAVLCNPEFTRRSAWVPGVLIGMLLALKMTNVVYLVLPCGYVTWRAVRQRQWGWLARVVAVSLVCGAASYAYSMLLTGNPTFPMFNSVFDSPYYPPVDFSDPRWHKGIGWDLPWKLTFQTDLYMEAAPGAIGLSLLVLIGGGLLALVRPGAGRWVLLGALLPAVVLFAEVQYVRYAFPALAVAGVVAVAALAQPPVRWPHVLTAVVVLLCGINIAFMANTNWVMRQGAWVGLTQFGPSHATFLTQDATPQHSLMDRMLARYPLACVLNADPGRPFTARVAGRGVSVSWYDPQMNRARKWAAKDPTGKRWSEIIRALGVSHVVVPIESDPGLRPALEALGARWEDRESSVELWRLDTGSGDNGRCSPQFFHARDTAHRVLHDFDEHD